MLQWRLIIMLLISGVSFTQDCSNVLFKGKVKDTIRPQGFYNLMIINRSTGQGVFGQPNGLFSVYVKNGDSLTLSVKGYPLIQYVVKADSNCQSVANFIIEGKPQEIAEVTVRPIKSLEQIREEREALALRETRQATGIDLLQSPITALYQALSKKERSKRAVAEMEYKDDQRKVVKELLRTYIAFDVVDLTEDEFDEFIYFLNMDPEFLKTATEWELYEYIRAKYEHYTFVKTQERIAEEAKKEESEEKN